MTADVIADLTARLRRLEDEQAIIKVLYTYAQALDYGDETAFGECFTADAVWHAVNQVERATIMRAEGTEGLVGFAAAHTRAPAVYHKHMVVAPMVEVDGDTGTGTSYVFLLVSEPADGLPFIGAFARYVDRYERGADGQWRIADRFVEVEMMNPQWSAVSSKHRAAFAQALAQR